LKWNQLPNAQTYEVATSFCSVSLKTGIVVFM